MSQTIQIPSLTTAERNALVGVKDGMMIFNTDVQLNQSWDGAAWVDAADRDWETWNLNSL